MTDLKFAHYFYPGVTTLDKLEREREKVAWNAARHAEHYASILKEMDNKIAELKAQEGKGVKLPEHQQSA